VQRHFDERSVAHVDFGISRMKHSSCGHVKRRRHGKTGTNIPNILACVKLKLQVLPELELI
jgi:hypothetical protein